MNRQSRRSYESLAQAAHRTGMSVRTLRRRIACGQSAAHRTGRLLLDLGDSRDLGPGANRIRDVDAAYDGAWERPVIGVVDAPTAVLIRPDGHVAWVGHASGEGLTEALTRWFGAAGV